VILARNSFARVVRASGAALRGLTAPPSPRKQYDFYDKMTMNRGGAARWAEFDPLVPLMNQGGFIPGVDHETPPAVSLEQYQSYLRLLNEFTS